MSESIVRSSLAPHEIAPLQQALVSAIRADASGYKALADIGIGMDAADVVEMGRLYGFGMDALTAGLTTGTVPTPVQFLQEWLPGIVQIITNARKIDDLVGVQTAGDWSDEEVVQMVLEATGQAVLYGDTTNVPFASWNPDFERRTIVRAESGIEVGVLEEARSSAVKINSSQAKRNAATLALQIFRNAVGFSGYSSGANRTYGFLNDPGLPSYVTVANGAASSPLWSTKTYNEIIRDVTTAMAVLQSGSGDNIDPYTAKMTMAVATDRMQYLATPAVYGAKTVRETLRETYPGLRIVSAPELNAANGGASVFYIYADSISDGASTDDGGVFAQVVPQQFRLLGVEKKAKGFIEAYSNATAGVLLKRPYGVVRRSGI